MSGKSRALLFLVVLCGCGGGGGDDGGSASGGHSYAGVWAANLLRVDDTCDLDSFPPSLENVGYLVNQDQTTVVAENIVSKMTLSGATINDGDGFVTTTAFPQSTDVADCPVVTATAALAFGPEDDGVVDDARLSFQLSCGAVTLCSTDYKGSAVRQ